jgi:hypothetical protein
MFSFALPRRLIETFSRKSLAKIYENSVKFVEILTTIFAKISIRVLWKRFLKVRQNCHGHVTQTGLFYWKYLQGMKIWLLLLYKNFVFANVLAKTFILSKFCSKICVGLYMLQ